MDVKGKLNNFNFGQPKGPEKGNEPSAGENPYQTRVAPFSVYVTGPACPASQQLEDKNFPFSSPPTEMFAFSWSKQVVTKSAIFTSSGSVVFRGG